MFLPEVRMAVVVLVVLMVLLVRPASSSHHLSVSCGSEVGVLQRNIRRLENRLLIRTWQVQHLQNHQYFRPLQPDEPDRKSLADSLPVVSNTTVGVSDHPNTSGSPGLLPPAGSLIVHDRDCSELFDRLRPPSGFYRIRPKPDQEPFLAFCDMEDGGGWTVLQRRRHGRVDFNRDWVDYRDGFGDFKLWNDEFWLGNERLSWLLSDGQNLVKVKLMDWEGKRSHAFYQDFRVSSELDKFRLQVGAYSGKAGDALRGGGGAVEQWSACLIGMQFSTKDQDNDRYLQGSCAQENKAGWWFNRCHAANLNGRFYQRGAYSGPLDDGVVWGTWRGLWYSLRHTAIKVRPLLFLDEDGSGAAAAG